MLGCDFSASVPVSYFIAGSWHQRITPRRSPPLNLRGAGIPTRLAGMLNLAANRFLYDFLVQGFKLVSRSRFVPNAFADRLARTLSIMHFSSTGSMWTLHEIPSETCSKFNKGRFSRFSRQGIRENHPNNKTRKIQKADEYHEHMRYPNLPKFAKF